MSAVADAVGVGPRSELRTGRPSHAACRSPVDSRPPAGRWPAAGRPGVSRRSGPWGAFGPFGLLFARLGRLVLGGLGCVYQGGCGCGRCLGAVRPVGSIVVYGEPCGVSGLRPGGGVRRGGRFGVSLRRDSGSSLIRSCFSRLGFLSPSSSGGLLSGEFRLCSCGCGYRGRFVALGGVVLCLVGWTARGGSCGRFWIWLLARRAGVVVWGVVWVPLVSSGRF